MSLTRVSSRTVLGGLRLAPMVWRGLILACLVATHASVGAGSEVPKEYQVKAAFLYNFTKFVDWPAACFAGSQAPIVIGVVGENPFGRELEAAVQDRLVHGRAIVVRGVRTPEEAQRCQVLFVPAGEERRFESLEAGHFPGVLTVGESERFRKLGGIVTFSTIDEKVRFELNMPVAERAELKVSAQLQKLAIGPRKRT